MAPMTKKGSAPVATASGTGASGDSCDRSCSKREEPDEGAALLGDLVADGAAEHRIAGFEGVEDAALGRGPLDFELDLAFDAGEGAQVEGDDDADHGNFLVDFEPSRKSRIRSKSYE